MKLLERLDKGWQFNRSGICSFTGASGPPPTAVDVKPPNPLFPALTDALKNNGPGAINTATSTFSNAANGVDVEKIYKSVVEASKRGSNEGRANIMSAMGASGMASSSDAMRSTADFELQTQSNLLQQLQQMQFQNEGLKLAGANGLMETYGSAAMAFAPSQEIVANSGGPSPFQQFTSAASGSAMAIAMLMAACWVAAELYGGWNSPEVYTLRLYGGTRKHRLGKSLVFLYVRFGQRLAKHIQKHRLSRVIVKALFDRLIKQAFNWRLSCHNQAY